MTHTIQSPKPRKQGATFADVPDESLFEYRGTLFRRSPDITSKGGSRRNAVNCHTGGLALFYDLDPVTLVSVQPIDPEPDPDVCTYGELARQLRRERVYHGNERDLGPSHHTATFGCTGVGEDYGPQWEVTDAGNAFNAPRDCTATDAIASAGEVHGG